VDDGNWLAGVRRVNSPNYDARPGSAAIDLLVIHAISLPPGQFGGGNIEQFFTNCLNHDAHAYFAGLRDVTVSAHFLVDREGVVTQFVALADRAWHAGASKWRERTACNDFSLGIELEGCDEQPFTSPQYAALSELIKRLRRRYPQLDEHAIVGHSTIAPGRKTDPGPYFDWARLAQSLDV